MGSETNPREDLAASGLDLDGLVLSAHATAIEVTTGKTPFLLLPEDVQPIERKMWEAVVLHLWGAIRKATAPIPMILHCPACGLQHVDAPEPGWDCPPHRSHLCRTKDGGCSHVWRPADVETTGVRAIDTAGSKDSKPVEPLRIAPSVRASILADADRGLGYSCVTAGADSPPTQPSHKVYRAPPDSCPECHKPGPLFMVEDDDGKDTDNWACARCGWIVVVSPGGSP